MVALVTGITGQDGAYLAKLLLNKNYRVVGLVRSIHTYFDFGLKYLNIDKDVELIENSLMDLSSLISIINQVKPDEIYNLAAESSVAHSFAEPISTLRFNTQSVLNLLEAIRITDIRIKFYQASSSEMFGQVNLLPITENTQMNPVSPYAISKASAYWTVNSYKSSYGLFACNGILFNHESFLRKENFFMKKIIKNAILIKHNKLNEIKVGNLEVSRDFGNAQDYVNAMYLMLQQKVAKNYLICSGKSIQLKVIVHYIFDQLNISKDRIIEDQSLIRPSEIINIYGDNSKAKSELGWKQDSSFFDTIDQLIVEEEEYLKTTIL